MYKEPKRYFKRFLLLTVVTLIVIVLVVALSAIGGVGLWIGLFFVVINLFLLLGMTMVSIIHFFKYLLDRSKHEDFVMHLINMLFSIFISGILMLFYLTIIFGAFVIILPFLA